MPPPAVQAPAWVADILNGVQAPISANNVAKIQAWNDCEGNASGGSGLPINNPFNTTLSAYGGSSVNGAGVKSYPSWAAGLQATLDTLQGSAYKGIVRNLQTDGPAGQFATAVGSSPWGTSGSCIGSRVGNSTNGGAPAGGSATASSGGSASASECVIKAPVVGCLITRSELKALRGGLLVTAGGAVFIVGALVLVAFGFERSGAQQAATRALRATPARPLARGVQRRQAASRRLSEARSREEIRTEGAVTRSGAAASASRSRSDSPGPPSAKDRDTHIPGYNAPSPPVPFGKSADPSRRVALAEEPF